MADPVLPVAARRSYAERANAVADLINRISLQRIDPEHWHETRDAAARAARHLANSLAADGL